ncbi:hypothetical protein D3273_26685 [Lichenibacterium minor]|uniref:Uncharacterized protein n=1 Tax=Lichenibacterium minor TaxID=2316528 RepID=A0A4Q2U270_9HYPH|nr:hypothetical protein [Lichenibacterium minor]RYC28931.1 hypothetical protein D3273_26685 [Lichenibacterium minor]
MRFVFAAAAVILTATPAAANSLKQVGDSYWIALASRRSADEAIAYARRYNSLQPAVVGSINGWYAVVIGPRAVAQGQGKALLGALAKSDYIPSDAYFTRGDGYTSMVWKAPPSPILATAKYDGETDATLQSGPLCIVLSRAPVDGDQRAAIAAGYESGKPAFAMIAGAEQPNEKPASEVASIRLDRSSPQPQAVLTYFWQGAHCCTITRIATAHADGTWKVVDGETLDGDGGYRFEDLTGSGEVDMVSADQSFLYAFASFASSVPPTKIHRLVGDRIADVTHEPRYYEFLKQELAGLESGVKPADPVWHDNGFLAGWVASKMLVGQGTDAWSRMLEGYDHNPDFGPEECVTGQPVEGCPDDKKSRIPFPIALKAFLVKGGYILDPSLYPVPRREEPPSAPVHQASVPPATPPALQQCVESADTARKLIFQAFVSRKIQPGEDYSAVTLEGDTTLEENDAGIGRVVCAVTYDFDLKPLLGHLAETGEFGRAESIARMIRRSGAIASTRVRYSVKPTATAGTTYVELLP